MRRPNRRKDRTRILRASLVEVAADAAITARRVTPRLMGRYQSAIAQYRASRT